MSRPKGTSTDFSPGARYLPVKSVGSLMGYCRTRAGFQGDLMPGSMGYAGGDQAKTSTTMHTMPQTSMGGKMDYSRSISKPRPKKKA